MNLHIQYTYKKAIYNALTCIAYNTLTVKKTIILQQQKRKLVSNLNHD